MLFSQTSLPQALLINKLRAKCPGSCFWHLSWNSYIVFYLFLPTLHFKLCTQSSKVMLVFCNISDTTHVHRVPEPCGFLTQKTTLIFFGPPKFFSCFRFYQKKTNLKFLIGLVYYFYQPFFTTLRVYLKCHHQFISQSPFGQQHQPGLMLRHVN